MSWILPHNWVPIFKLFNFKWKLLILFLVLLVVGSLIFWVGSAYLSWTEPIPKEGGKYTEGVIGQPAYINPLLSQTSEADADLVQIIYSGLFNYNEKGEIVEDMAERYDVSEDKKVYIIYLKKNIKWHDGENLDASDVHFTFSILKDKTYKSPLRFNWQGIDIKQIDDYAIEFTLKEPYFGFLDNLTTGIIPKHIWENIAPEKFTLAEQNLRPIGSGPYKVFDFQKDADGNILTYDLVSFPEYHKGVPNISKITFSFYFNENSDAIVDDYNKKEIMGMSNISSEKISDIKNMKTTNLYEVNVPRYFSVFFNQNKSVPLASSEVREALAYATDKKEIINEVLKGKGVEIYSLFLPGTEEYNDNIEKREFNIDRANSLLEEKGWKLGEDGIREKDGVIIEFDLYTTDWPPISQTADIIRDQWEKIGARVNVNILTVSDLNQNHIKTREYDALLFGQNNNFNADPYAFWHSSRKNDTGLNFAKFEDEEVDKILDEAREILNRSERAEKYKKLQEIVANQTPSIFLYSPSYIYPISKKIKGINIQNVNAPSYRFSDIHSWYIKTKRIRK